jgi:hypothetical protein
MTDTRALGPSAHFPKFVLHLSDTFHELRKDMGTSKPVDSNAACHSKLLNGIGRS